MSAYTPYKPRLHRAARLHLLAALMETLELAAYQRGDVTRAVILSRRILALRDAR